MQLAKYEKKEIDKSNKFDTKNVVTTLENLMNKVTEQEITAETVHAACNCADKITDILKVHLEVERMRRKFGE